MWANAAARRLVRREPRGFAALSSAAGGAFTRRSVVWAPTEKQAPADAAVPSHQLLLRGGFVRKSGHGVYALLPLGKRVAAKLEAIIDDEMRRIDGNKLDLPVLIPAELWQQSGRWQTRGPELMTLADRREDTYALGPTHEESITSLVAAHYAAAPGQSLRVYQVGRKFRDEIRPRFGLLRAREFVMKDMYSFDMSFDHALQTYEDVVGAYERILRTRLKLPIAKVEADSGNIGGNLSHEFHVLAPIGEDALLSCSSDECGYAANVEKAQGVLPPLVGSSQEDVSLDDKQVCDLLAQVEKQISERDVGVWKTIEQLQESTGSAGVTLKVLHKPQDDVEAGDTTGPLQVALVFARSDREVNELAIKPFFDGDELMPLSRSHFRDLDVSDATAVHLSVFLDDSLKDDATPIASTVRVAASTTSLLVEWGHFRLAAEGDLCPRCSGHAKLEAKRGIEVGHVFYLGQKYSKPFNATFTDSHGAKQLMEMGCFGMGVTRLMAAAVEVSHDQHGIVWPTAIAPFKVLVMTIGNKKGDDPIAQTAQSIANDLGSSGVPGLAGDEVVLDDRWSESPGSKLAESELLGYPFRVVVGKRFAKEGLVEVQTRATLEKTFVPPEELVPLFRSLAEAGEL